MATVAVVVLDGVDVTEFASTGSVTIALNRVGQAQVKINMEVLAGLFGTMIPGAGSYLKIYFQTDADSTPVLWHHGRVMLREITATDDTGYAVFNSSDALELWAHRPVRDPDGDFSNPNIIKTFKYGPQIVEAMVMDSEGAGSGPPSDAEGPTRLSIGNVAAGITDLTGAPVDWPTTMAELASLLISTGTLDVVCIPIEFDGFENYGRLELYNGDYGIDRQSSVILQYGFGAFNVKALRWNEDMSQLCNKLWYYLGPRRVTPTDLQGNQHWQANITGDDPGLAYPPGGALSPPASSSNNIIGVTRYRSQQFFDVRMDIKIYDALGDEAIVAHELFRRQWQEEQFLRSNPQTIVHVTPNRDTEIGSFYIGDLITVEADVGVAGGNLGGTGQRVYEFSIAWDDDSVAYLSELQVSSDASGMTI